MREDFADDLLRRTWGAQPTIGAAPSLPELKRRAWRTRLPFAIRNGLEYAAALTVVIVAGAGVVNEGRPLLRLAHLLIVAGVLYLVVQLHARASARKPPRDGTAMEYLAFLRLELARQQRALESVWRWYLLPFVPGTLVFVMAQAVEHPEFPWLTTLAALAIGFVGLHILNRHAASRIGKRLAALDSLVPDRAGRRDPMDRVSFHDSP